MIILDTNVVSEPLRPAPDGAVIAWLDEQTPETLYLTAINLAELLEGVERLPGGKRKSRLAQALDEQMLPLFEGRILSFDQAAAEAFARVNARARKAGLTMGFADAQIAAIAAAHGFAVATRDVAPFEAAGIKTLNPWS